MANPDDLCGVCDVKRENHADVMHEFSLVGILKKKEPPAPPRQQPPRHRDDPNPPMMPGGNIPISAAVHMEHELSLRLVERLMAKGIFSGEDLIYVLGGNTDDSQERPQ